MAMNLRLDCAPPRRARADATFLRRVQEANAMPIFLRRGMQKTPVKQDQFSSSP